MDACSGHGQHRKWSFQSFKVTYCSQKQAQRMNNAALCKKANYVSAKVACFTHMQTLKHTLLHRASSVRGTVRKRRRECKKTRDFCFLPSSTSSNFLRVASTVSSHEFACEETEELPREAVLLPSQCYFPSLY